jgi:hypothetical protein
LSGASPYRRGDVTAFYLIHPQDRASSLRRQDDNLLPIFKRLKEDLSIGGQRSPDDGWVVTLQLSQFRVFGRIGRI